MIIQCPNCKKKFEIEDNLIPVSGRLLQCSSCSNKWFFKKNDKKINLPKKEIIRKNGELDIPVETVNIIKEAENVKSNKIHKKTINYKISFFKIILIFIITAIALIILLDTFKIQINNILPGFNFFLDNFYLTLNDLFLFTKDLIRK